jgi:hypothetical protein
MKNPVFLLNDAIRQWRREGVFRHHELLLLLLAADLVFIVLHVLHMYTPFADNLSFSLEEDRGYGEVFQYVKFFWICLMLTLAFRHSRQLVYCAWALLFSYLLLDDALLIHEKLGVYLAEALEIEPMLGLRPQDFGELMVSAAAGSVLLSLIALAYLRSGNEAKSFSIAMAALFGILVFFGVGVDMLHSALRDMPGGSLLGLLEDGGELVAVSLTCGFLFAWLRARAWTLVFAPAARPRVGIPSRRVPA